MRKILKFIPLLAVAITVATACNAQKEWIDYAEAPNMRLSHEYDGHDFYTDGIGEVKLKTAIDGDTAHFFPVVKDTSGKPIKARFYGIDTPESTGRVQEYGKPASNFTKEKLVEADKNGTIVVSSTFDGYGAPVPDSTGSRFVSLIWIHPSKKHAPVDELRLLNLMIVQEGLSWVKHVDDVPRYVDTFYAAEQQAKDWKLNLHSGVKDPTFPDSEYTVVSLLDLKRDNEKILNDPDYVSEYNGVRVCVTGAVAGYSKGVLYLQDYFTKDEGALTEAGEYASINIFTGMAPVSSKYTKRNTYIQVYGLAQHTENFGFQITDTEGRFPPTPFDEYDTQVILKADENVDTHELYTFDYTKEQLNNVVTQHNYESLNCSVKVTEKVKVSDVYINEDGDEISLDFEGCEFGVFLSFPYAGDPKFPGSFWNKKDFFLGEEFYISGIYTYHKYERRGETIMEFQVNPSTGADILWAPAVDNASK